MIPLRDVIPSRTYPVVTVTLIAANVAAFLWEMSLGPRTLDAVVRVYGIVPYHYTLLAAQGTSTVIDRITPMFTSMFLHGGFLHIIGNMLYLWIFGDNVEDEMGHGRFLFFYLLCGTIAGMVHIYTNPYSTLPTIGASGAIAGVMGAYLVLFPNSRILTLLPIFIFWQIIEVPAIFFLGLWFLLQLASGSLGGPASQAAGGVAFWAHVGGFVAGAIGVLVFRQRRRRWGGTYS